MSATGTKIGQGTQLLRSPRRHPCSRLITALVERARQLANRLDILFRHDGPYF